MTDTLVLVWSGTSFTSSSISSTDTNYYHLVGTNMTVDWGDGTTGTITSGTRFTHTYSYSGTYTIVITGSSISKIGSYCFRDCTCLKKIIIPPSISKFYSYSLDGCSGLQQLVFTNDTPPSFAAKVGTIPTTCKIYVPNSSYKSGNNYPSSSTYTYIEQNTTEMAKAAIIARGIFNKVYPVGSIYMTTEGISPAEKIGGAWEQIKDRFLLGSGTATLGATGGEATHTLTINEMPSHNHSRLTHPQGWAENNLNGAEILTRKQNSGATAAITKAYEGYTGGGAAHNNMPPYFVVCMWRRLV